MDQNGISIIVAGGAAGLGAATVRLFAKNSATVIVFDRDEQQGQAIAAELGSSVRFVAGDILEVADVERALAAAEDLPVRLALNCAATGTFGPILDEAGQPSDYESFRKDVAINIIGNFNFMRLVASHMAASAPDERGERGVIISTSSIIGLDGAGPHLAATGSKAAIAAMTLPAARELSPFGIRTVTIAPGSFATEATHAMSDEIIAMLANTALFPKRRGIPDEFAQLVEHIYKNSFLNGEVIRLDGGARLSFNL